MVFALRFPSLTELEYFSEQIRERFWHQERWIEIQLSPSGWQ